VMGSCTYSGGVICCY